MVKKFLKMTRNSGYPPSKKYVSGLVFEKSKWVDWWWFLSWVTSLTNIYEEVGEVSQSWVDNCETWCDKLMNSS